MTVQERSAAMRPWLPAALCLLSQQVLLLLGPREVVQMVTAGSKAQSASEAEREKGRDSGPSTPRGYHTLVSTKLHLLKVSPPPAALSWESTLQQVDLWGPSTTMAREERLALLRISFLSVSPLHPTPNTRSHYVAPAVPELTM